jgi:KTSC domain
MEKSAQQPAFNFEAHFPNIATWVIEYGHIQIGTDDNQESFIAAYDRDNEVVWESSDEVYNSLAEAFTDLEAQLTPYLDASEDDGEDDDEDDEEFDYSFSKPVKLRPNEINKIIEVESSMIQAVKYSPESQVLEVWFNSGAHWAYEEVSSSKFRALLESDSKGSFMNSFIIDEHPAERISKKGRRPR